MGEFMHDDICEQIFVRLDVEDIIRCKSVCKSWKSLIKHPLFVKTHRRRQVTYHKAVVPYSYFSKYGPEYFMVGSSNGLACITSFDGDEIIVANPWTREERIMQKPHGVPEYSCWGFGYDSFTNDYKVVLIGAEGSEKTTFHVLSLKSNVWKRVGHVNYKLYSYDVQIGTLCNGALHWVMQDKHTEEVIISFDLSKEVFTENNQPDDAIRECSFLAIQNEWVYNNEYLETDMELKKHNVIEYWEHIMGCYTLRIESKKPRTFIHTTVMPSLISPHLQEGNE